MHIHKDRRTDRQTDNQTKAKALFATSKVTNSSAGQIFVVFRLYTVDGDLIHQPHTQLQNKAFYVAVGSEFGGFKQVKYGNPQRPAFVAYASNRYR